MVGWRNTTSQLMGPYQKLIVYECDRTNLYKLVTVLAHDLQSDDIANLGGGMVDNISMRKGGEGMD